jgi:aspartyl-tRNA(Asn)/glutamyl-tRNA(Gln) amidotransferase subunit A
LVGLKPTYGRVSLAGVYPLSTSLDHVGPMTRSVSDAAILLQYISGYDEKDPRTIKAPAPGYIEKLAIEGIEGAKIGSPSEILETPLDREIRTSLKGAASKIESLGGEITEIETVAPETVQDVSRPILSAEAASQHHQLLEEHSDRYGSDVLERFRAGQKIPTIEYIRAIRKRESIKRKLENIFEKVDFILYPSVQIQAPKIGETTLTLDSEEINVLTACTLYARLANITGLPAIVMPWGYSSRTLPLSIQLIAPRYCETELLNVALTLENETPELRNKISPLIT